MRWVSSDAWVPGALWWIGGPECPSLGSRYVFGVLYEDDVMTVHALEILPDFVGMAFVAAVLPTAY